MTDRFRVNRSVRRDPAGPGGAIIGSPIAAGTTVAHLVMSSVMERVARPTLPVLTVKHPEREFAGANALERSGTPLRPLAGREGVRIAG